MEKRQALLARETKIRSAWDHFHFCTKSPTVKEALCKWCTFRVLLPADIKDLQSFCKTAQSHLERHHPDMVLVAQKNPIVLDSTPSTLLLDPNSQSAQEAQSSSPSIQAAVGKGLSLINPSNNGTSTQIPTKSRSTALPQLKPLTWKSTSGSKPPKIAKTEKDESSKRTYNTRKASLPSYNFDNEEDNSTSDSDFSASGSRESSPDSLPSSKGSVKVLRSKPGKQSAKIPGNPPGLLSALNFAKDQLLHGPKRGDALSCTPIPLPMPNTKQTSSNHSRAPYNPYEALTITPYSERRTSYNLDEALTMTPYSEKRKTLYHPSVPTKTTGTSNQQGKPPLKVDINGMSIERTVVRHPVTLTSSCSPSSGMKRAMPMPMSMKQKKFMPSMKPIKVPHKVLPKEDKVMKQRLQGTKLTIVEFFKFERNPRSKRVGCFCRGCNRRLRFPKKRIMRDHLEKQHPEMLKYVQSPTKDPSSERILKSLVSGTTSGGKTVLSRKKTFGEWEKNPDDDDESIFSDTSNSNADYESSQEETSEDEGTDSRAKKRPNRSNKPKTIRPVPSQETIADNFYGLIRIKSEMQLLEEEPVSELPTNMEYANMEYANMEYANCLLCSGIVRPKPRARQTNAFKMWNKACSVSLCELLNLNDSFQNIFETFPYCQHCEQLVQDIDFTFKSMKSLQKTLSGFQQRLDFILSSSYEMVVNPGITPEWVSGREPPAPYEQMISTIVQSAVTKAPAPAAGYECDPFAEQSFHNSFDDADVDEGLLQPEVVMDTEELQELTVMDFPPEASQDNFQQRDDELEVPIMFATPEEELEVDRDPLDTKPAFLTSYDTLPNEPTIINAFSVNPNLQNSSEEPRYTAEDVNPSPMCKTEISVDPIFETNFNKANIGNNVIVMNQPLFAEEFSVDPIFEIIPSQQVNQSMSSNGISVDPIYSNVGRNFEETGEQVPTKDSSHAFEDVSNLLGNLEEPNTFSVFPILENSSIPVTSFDSNHFGENEAFVIQSPLSAEDEEPVVVKIEPN